MTFRRLPLAVVLALTLVPAAAAQEAAPEPGDAVSLSVDVTISRYRGGELAGSQPYTLSVTADRGLGTLGLYNRVAVPSGPPNVGPDGVRRPGIFNYEQVGTQIDCIARNLGEGRYEVNIIIEESSVDGGEEASADASAVPDWPVFRSFNSNNTLVLRDGQSRQYLAAANRVSGETIRVDVTLTVLD